MDASMATSVSESSQTIIWHTVWENQESKPTGRWLLFLMSYSHLLLAALTCSIHNHRDPTWENTAFMEHFVCTYHLYKSQTIKLKDTNTTKKPAAYLITAMITNETWSIKPTLWLIRINYSVPGDASVPRGRAPQDINTIFSLLKKKGSSG